MPQRIQLRRAKGWRMPPEVIKIDRSTRWGNPYRPNEMVTPAMTVEALRSDLETRGGFIALVRGREIFNSIEDIRRDLNGRDLACWCAIGGPCHGDLLIKVADGGAFEIAPSGG